MGKAKVHWEVRCDKHGTIISMDWSDENRHENEVKAQTTNGWAHIDFLTPNK